MSNLFDLYTFPQMSSCQRHLEEEVGTFLLHIEDDETDSGVYIKTPLANRAIRYCGSKVLVKFH